MWHSTQKSSTLRLYIDIDMGGTKINSLIDTGSSKIYIGSTIQGVIGEACFPANFSGTEKLAINCKTIPRLTKTCILGMDYAEKLRFVLYLRSTHLWLPDEPIVKFSFGSAKEN